MDSRTGELFESMAAAIEAGVKEPVEVVGTPDAVARVSAAVKAAHKRARKAQRRARRNNR